MLQITKNYVMDENHQPIAVQIPIADFDKIVEILENYVLIKLMAESEDDERLAKDEEWRYYQLSMQKKYGKLNILKSF